MSTLSTHQLFDLRLNRAFALLRENRAYQYWLLAAITILAAGLRFYKLGEWSFWIDEIYTINRAQIHLSNPVTFLRNLPTTLWLPVSLILTEGFLKVLGVTEWNARIASNLIGIISIPILFFPVRKLIGSSVALILALLLAISPWHLFWSQNARFYTSLLLLYNLAAFAFFYAIERDRPIYLLIFYVLFYFSVSERLIAVFIFPVLLAYLAALWIFPYERPPGLRKRNILLLIVPLVALVLLDGLRFLLINSSIILDAIQDFGGQQFDDPLRLLVAIFYNISFPIVSLSMVAGLYSLIRKSRVELFFLLSAVVPVILFVLLNPFMFTKDRFVFMTLPNWFILAALAIRGIFSQTQGLGKLLALGMVVMLIAEASGTNLLYYHVNGGNRRDWRTAFEIIKENSLDGDIYVAWWPQFGPYYLGREIIPYKDVTPDSVVESGKRYWFVVDSETVWGNYPLIKWLQTHARLVEVLSLRMPEDDFNLRIYLYDPVRYNVSK